MAASTDVSSTSEPKSSTLVYIGASATLLSAINVGCCLGYNSPALPSMIYNATINPMERASIQLVSSADTHTLSWIGSVVGIGALIGSLLSGRSRVLLPVAVELL
jgi:hypothetical protein